MTIATPQKLNISPSQFQPQGENSFVMLKQEWLAIQRYVLEAKQLPREDDQLREAIKMLPDDDIKIFYPLKDAYRDIYDHCTTWDTTYRTAVDLANDIRAYSTQAKVFYGAIKTLGQQLDQDPNNETHKNNLKQVLEELAKKADMYAQNAEDVLQKISKFATDTEHDKTTLDNLHETYTEQFGESSNEAQSLQAEITKQMGILQQANADYEHSVTVAATTPTYAWILGIGSFIATVVAGVYGDKAVKALKRAKEAQAQIDQLNAQIRRNTRLMILIVNAKDHMYNIRELINEALGAIQKVRGSWTALSSDLKTIKNLIDQDITQATGFIRDLQVDVTIEQWQKVGKIADGFVVNAFITVTDEAVAV